MWVEQPVEHALRREIKTVGRYLAEVLNFYELQEMVERVAGTGNDAEERAVAIDHCFDGLECRDGGTWLT